MSLSVSGIVMPSLTVYESEGGDSSVCKGRESFIDSRSRLVSIGVCIELVVIHTVYDMPGDTEAGVLLREKGMSVLPITVFDGVVVDSGSYPSDSVLADYLDVPDGVLKAVRSGAPEKKAEYCCMCCNRY